MKHKQKVKLARRLLSDDEIKRGVNKFDSEKWRERKRAIQRRIEKRNNKEPIKEKFFNVNRKLEEAKIEKEEFLRSGRKLTWWQKIINFILNLFK
jgi:hypothetical protein